jgi:hypothetical protein
LQLAAQWQTNTSWATAHERRHRIGPNNTEGSTQMLKSVTVHNNRVPQQRGQDVKLLKESGVHKLVITDRDGNCLAFVLAWDSFDYDAETDTYVCVADSDGRELMTMYAAGEIKSAPGTNMYVVTAPDGSDSCRALQAL